LSSYLLARKLMYCKKISLTKSAKLKALFFLLILIINVDLIFSQFKDSDSTDLGTDEAELGSRKYSPKKQVAREDRNTRIFLARYYGASNVHTEAVLDAIKAVLGDKKLVTSIEPNMMHQSTEEQLDFLLRHVEGLQDAESVEEDQVDSPSSKAPSKKLEALKTAHRHGMMSIAKEDILTVLNVNYYGSRTADARSQRGISGSLRACFAIRYDKPEGTSDEYPEAQLIEDVAVVRASPIILVDRVRYTINMVRGLVGDASAHKLPTHLSKVLILHTNVVSELAVEVVKATLGYDNPKYAALLSEQYSAIASLGKRDI
jgi:hypothetical protein